MDATPIEVLPEVARLLARAHPELRVTMDDATYEVYVRDVAGRECVIDAVTPSPGRHHA